MARIGEEGTATTAAVFGLNVVTGWDKRRPDWVDVAWLGMRVHVGRQRKMGVDDVIDVEGQEEPPTPWARKRKGHPPQGDTEPPPPPLKSPAYGHPGGAGRAGGADGGAGAQGGGAQVGAAAVEAAAVGGLGGARDQGGGRQPRPTGPPVQSHLGQAGRRVAVGGRHQGAGPPSHHGENSGARPGDGAQGKATGTCSTGKGGA